MKHTLSAEHKEHLRKVGISEPANSIEITHEEYERHKADWKRTLPDADEATLHKHVLSHAAWKQHSEAEPMTSELAPTVNHVTVNHAKLETRVLIAIGFLILMVLLFGGKAHAQFSHISTITVQDNGSLVGFHASPFTFNFTGSGCTVTNSGSTDTINCQAGTVTNNPAGADFELQTYADGAFGFVPEVGLGKVLIDQGPGNAPVFADPLVQGTQAAASTTIPNPVVSGGSDYGGTAAVRVWKVDSSGNGYAVITTLPALPAGTNVIGHVIADSGSTTAVTSLPTLPAGTNVIGHVIADSGSTTAVTGNVASTVADGANVTLGAKADAKSTATDTTAITFMQVLKEISFMEQTPASRAVTNAGTFAVQAAQSGTWNFGISAGANLIGSVNLGTTPDPCGPGQAKSYAFYDASTNGATQIVALSSGKIVYVCSYSITSSSTTANTIKLVYGTGSNCATGQTAITPGYVLQAATSTGPIGKVNPNSAGLATAASNELCVLTNAAQAAQVEVSYVQQ